MEGKFLYKKNQVLTEPHRPTNFIATALIFFIYG